MNYIDFRMHGATIKKGGGTIVVFDRSHSLQFFHLIDAIQSVDLNIYAHVRSL